MHGKFTILCNYTEDFTSIYDDLKNLFSSLKELSSVSI